MSLAKKSYIVVRSSFQGLHSWPACPFPEKSFLKNAHRHVFHIEISLRVYEDRQLEFFMVKDALEEILKEYHNRDMGSSSCEHLCDIIQYRLFQKGFNTVSSVSVFEDGENGALNLYE